LRSIIVMALCLAGLPTLGLNAQAVFGRVLDASTGGPNAVASVSLIKDSVVVASTLADNNGEFQISAPDSGHYQVRAGRFGYVTATGERILLSRGEYVTVEMRLEGHGIALEPLRVTARSRLERGRDGFARRRELGKGWFLTKDSIRARKPTLTTDMFMGIPGLQIRDEPDGRIVVQTLKGHCFVVFANHMSRPLGRSSRVSNVARMGLRSPRGAGSGSGAGSGQVRSLQASGSMNALNRQFTPTDVEGIEVYRSFSEVPAELRGGIRMSEIWPSGFLGACGVALVWSKSAW
jgi:hypothetical protein